MDRWLTAIEADQSDIAHEIKVTRNKPFGLFDACINNGLMYEWRPGSVCEMLFTYTGLSRMVAGGPNTDDVLKCQLKPLNRADYNVSFSDVQWARLQQTFAAGVCDFSKPGIGEQPPIAPWLTFSSGPGGTPLGPPPTSH